MPPAGSAEEAYAASFQRMAGLLLNTATCYAGGRPHRFTELEFYFTSPGHPDPFTHGDPMQCERGRWYFHRTGNQYRGGSYKGLDITIGEPGAPGGILIRGLEQLGEDHRLLDGPSLCVDHILALTGHASIASLVSTFSRGVDLEPSGTSPLYVLLDAAPASVRRVYASARVGLTLKRGTSEERVRFLSRPYRFLTEPVRIKKGRLHVAVALHAQGHPVEEVARLTGSTVSQVRRYIAQYEAGRGRAPAEFARDLSTDETCQLLGACAR
ncbi:hypothetical protein BO221_26720 [Archangium sp. Cb G35]|nr:hypothetical protein BO221_26720 [Archangium sp. Cb G35]